MTGPGRWETVVLVADGTRTAQREIRLALVLNGGVSLAIWIGGVVAEIDRARRAGLPAAGMDDEVVGVYRELLALTGSLLRTDVIAGASAGGLNGCLLASAIVSGGAVDDVRDTWIELGSFTHMLRSGLQKEPPSLLKGDDYFLPRVEAELRRRLNVGAAVHDVAFEHSAAAATRRLELFVTGTNLTGQPVGHRDDFGGTLVDHEHRALFWFGHQPELHVSSFADRDAPRRLARVARSTASFPGAFEASFCRVQEAEEASSPSLQGVATFQRDAWVVDGGILDNAPFRPALEAIQRAPASGPVRRVLCYVTPYATSPDERPATVSNPPALGSVVGAAFNLPRDLTLTETLEDVADYKERVRNRRASRGTVAMRLGDAGLAASAEIFYGDYRQLRASMSADDVLRRALAGDLGRVAQGSARSVQRPAATGARLVRRGVRLPWIPGPTRTEGEPWGWGLAPIGRSSLLVLDLLARTLAVTPTSSWAEDGRAIDRIVAARGALSTAHAFVRYRRAEYFRSAEGLYAELPETPEARSVRLTALNEAPLDLTGIDERELDDLARLVTVAAAFRRTIDADPNRLECLPRMQVVAHALGDGGAAAIELLERHAASGVAPERRAALLAELRALVGAGPADSDEQRLRRLLDLEVLYEALVQSSRDHDQTLLFMRLNAEARCELDGSRQTPEEKLSGLGLAHFASFYKGSWRANDWMWGRLDGASRLVDVLLDPWAVRLELSSPGAPAALAEQLATIARVGDDGLADILGELAALAGWNLENEPPSLERTRAAVRRRVQLLIARDELPAVARAARDDVERDGAAPDAPSLAWAGTVPDMAEASDAEVERSLARLPLPRDESLTTELGSNLLTRNLATIAAVSSAALAGPHGGVPKGVRLAPKALRGLFLPFYGLTWGLTTRRALVRAVTLVAVLVAVAIVVWGVFADVDARQAAGDASSDVLAKPPAGVHLVAALVLLGALALGVLRGGLAGIAILVGFAAVYLALVFTPVPDDLSDAAGRLWRSEPVLVAGVALLACGLVASLLARPLAVVSRLREQRAQNVSNSS